MTPKELIAAAKAVQQAVKQPSDDDIMDCSKLCSDEQMLALVDHILSTVREDDDERFTSEWATSFPIAKLGMIELSDGESIDIARDGSVWLCTDVSLFLFDHIKTRGDFRALCRLLGVTLKEEE